MSVWQKQSQKQKAKVTANKDLGRLISEIISNEIVGVFCSYFVQQKRRAERTVVHSLQINRILPQKYSTHEFSY